MYATARPEYKQINKYNSNLKHPNLTQLTMKCDIMIKGRIYSLQNRSTVQLDGTSNKIVM